MGIGNHRLGQMGFNMAERLRSRTKVGFPASTSIKTRDRKADGAGIAGRQFSLVDGEESFLPLVPSGYGVHQATPWIRRSRDAALMERGDTFIDGGQSKYKDTPAPPRSGTTKGFHSSNGHIGGVWGLKEGYSS